MPKAYYNEIDPFAAAWIRNLIAAGHVAPGDVDERDIREVRPDDLRGYTQLHFFAGIGVWSHALRLAGVSDATPLFTGSCPCQPYSAAGKQAGFADERHLWPAWFNLIRELRPQHIFGEQVASPAALQWLDLVQDDLEGAGYAVGAVDLGAACCGAPHIRQRLYFVAHAALNGKQSFDGQPQPCIRQQEPFGGRHLFSDMADAVPAGRPEGRAGTGHGSPAGSGGPGLLAHANGPRGGYAEPEPGRRAAAEPIGHGTVGLLADAECDGRGSGRPGETDGRNPVQPDRRGAVGELGYTAQHGHEERERENGQSFGGSSAEGRLDIIRAGADDGSGASELGHPGVSGLARRSRQSRDDGAQQPPVERTGGPTGGFWADADWIYCRDGKWRAAQRGTFPLVDGSASRMGCRRDPGEPIHAEASAEARSHRLRAYGNAIVAPLAAEFIAAYLDTLKDRA